VTLPALALAGDVPAAATLPDGALVVLLHDDGVLAGALAAEAAREAPADRPLLPRADADPPATRPNTPADDLLERVRAEDLGWVVVTTGDGRFLGVVDGPALLDLARIDRLP